MEQFVFSPDFGDSMIRFAICILVNWLIVHFLYYKKGQRRDFYFTFMLISVVLFFLVSMMMSMDRGKATMGVGLGLFGIFSIMRYRTDTMPVREMTYIFIVVSLSVVHAMASSLGIDEFGQLVGTPLLELICIDAVTIIAVAACEALLKTETSKVVQYDRIELVKPEKKEELIADLEGRLGLKITNVRVGAVDLLRDMAILRVYYVGTDSGDVKDMLEIKKSEYANV